MAGREVVGDADPYAVLQVAPHAGRRVIAAAFAVLREEVLASGADDAPRRLAELNRAHRTLSDPARRAAHDAGIGPAGGVGEDPET